MTVLRPSGSQRREATSTGRERGSAVRTTRSAISLSYVVLLVGVAIALVPFLYVVSTSMKETTSLFSYPPDWIPSPIYWGNFESLFADHPFVRWTLNTLFVAGTVTGLKLWFDSMAGYALAKMEFSGKRGVALLFLLSVAIPISAADHPAVLCCPLPRTVEHLLGSDPATSGESTGHLHGSELHCAHP